MKKLRPINEALQGCLTEEEKAAGAVVYDGYPFGIKPKVFLMSDLVTVMEEAVAEARKEQDEGIE
jgi:hypothetical protein